MSTPKSRLITRLAKAISKYRTADLYEDVIGTPLEAMEISTCLRLSRADLLRIWNARQTSRSISDLEICIKRFMEMTKAAQSTAPAALVTEEGEEGEEGEEAEEERAAASVTTEADQGEEATASAAEFKLEPAPEPAEEAAPPEDDSSEEAAAGWLADVVSRFPSLADFERQTNNNALNARPIELLKFGRGALLDLWSARQSGRENAPFVDRDKVFQLIKSKLAARKAKAAEEAEQRAAVESSGLMKAAEDLADTIGRFDSISAYKRKLGQSPTESLSAYALGFEYLDLEQIWAKRGLYVFNRDEILKAIFAKFTEKAAAKAAKEAEEKAAKAAKIAAQKAADEKAAAEKAKRAALVTDQPQRSPFVFAAAAPVPELQAAAEALKIAAVASCFASVTTPEQSTAPAALPQSAPVPTDQPTAKETAEEAKEAPSKIENMFEAMNRIVDLKAELKAWSAALVKWLENMEGEAPQPTRAAEIIAEIKAAKAALRSYL